MNRFFNLDGKFYRFGTLLWDVIILTFLWTITSLPIITIGASTTAVYYVTTREISNREGYVTKDFFRSFKTNFIKATGVTLLFMVVYGVVFVNIRYLPVDSVMFPMQFVILAAATGVLVFAFPLLSRFELGFFELIQKSFFLAVGHFLTTITCLVLLVAVYMLVMWMPILFVVCVGFYCLLTSLMFMRIFKKYLPEMDTAEYDEKRYKEQTANEESDITS